MNRVSGNYPRETLIKTSVMVGEMLMVESHESQDGGVQISYMVAVYRSLMPELIGFTITRSRLYSSTSQPVGKSLRVMIAPPILALRYRLPPELTTPDNQGFLQQSALFQVLKQPGNRLVNLGAVD